MSVGDIRVKDCYVFFYLCQRMERTTFRDRPGPLQLRARKKDTNLKPTRKLDKRSSRGMLYENEELRMRTMEISAEVDRGQSEVKKLRKENEMLKKEIWWLRDEYDRLEDAVKHVDDPADGDGGDVGGAGCATGGGSRERSTGPADERSRPEITEVDEEEEEESRRDEFSQDNEQGATGASATKRSPIVERNGNSRLPRSSPPPDVIGATRNLVRATLSPELDKQIRDDCFNLDHLLDIANSFNQDNAYGTLELYRRHHRRDDDENRVNNNSLTTTTTTAAAVPARRRGSDEVRDDDGGGGGRLGADEFAARRTFFQSRTTAAANQTSRDDEDDDGDGDGRRPFSTLSRRQAILTEKIRSNGTETQVIQEAQLRRTDVVPDGGGGDAGTASTETVTVVSSSTAGAAAGAAELQAACSSSFEADGITSRNEEDGSSDNAAARFRSKSFLFLKPQLRPPSEPATKTTAVGADGDQEAVAEVTEITDSPRCKHLARRLPPSSGSSNNGRLLALSAASPTTPLSPPPGYEFCSNTWGHNGAGGGGGGGGNSRHSAPYSLPPRTATSADAGGGLSASVDGGIDGGTSPSLAMARSSSHGGTLNSYSRTRVRLSPAPIIRLCSVDPNTIAIPTVALRSAAAADDDDNGDAAAVAGAGDATRRLSVSDVTAEEVIDELDSQFGVPTDQLVRAVRVAPERDVVYVCAASPRSMDTILSKGLSIRGVPAPLVPLATASRVAYLTGVPDHFSDAAVRMLLTAFGTPVGEVDRRYHRGVDTGDRLVRLLPRPSPAVQAVGDGTSSGNLALVPTTTTTTAAAAAAASLEEIRLPKYVTVAGTRISMSLVDGGGVPDGDVAENPRQQQQRHRHHRFFETAQVAEVFSVYKSLPRICAYGGEAPPTSVDSVAVQVQPPSSTSTPSSAGNNNRAGRSTSPENARNLMPVVEIQRKPAVAAATPTVAGKERVKNKPEVPPKNLSKIRAAAAGGDASKLNVQQKRTDSISSKGVAGDGGAAAKTASRCNSVSNGRREATPASSSIRGPMAGTSSTKRPAPLVPASKQDNPNRASFMQEATRRLTSKLSSMGAGGGGEPQLPTAAGGRHWPSSSAAGGRPSFLRRTSGMPPPSPLAYGGGGGGGGRRPTSGAYGVFGPDVEDGDGEDGVSEMNKSTAGDVVSVKSYGSRSKDLPWCGCWGNGCF